MRESLQNRFASWWSRRDTSQWQGVVLVASLALVAILLADDYGKSWDEYVHIAYAEQTLEIYQGVREPTDIPLNMRFYGPFYSVTVEMLKGPLTRLAGGWVIADARHFLYFLSFILATAGVYAVCRRYVSPKSALVGSLLFASQPVLFGHGFINPKDVPFQGFFVAALWLGMRAVDHLQPPATRTDPPHPAPPRLPSRVRAAWKEALVPRRAVFIGSVVVLVLALLEFFVLNAALEAARMTLRRAYDGDAWPPIALAFQWIAEDAHKTPLSAYMARLDTAYFLGRWLVLAGLVGLVVLSLRRILHSPEFRAMWWVALAGLVLGLGVSIRIHGLYAGALVSVLMIARGRQRGLGPLVPYWIIAAAVTYAAWPYLWMDPFRRFWESLTVMGNFGWDGMILYGGAIYRMDQLPWDFGPRLMALQFTLPAVALILVGIVRAARDVLRRVPRALEVVILASWFIVPTAYRMLPGTDVFDNFRHLLFAIPALFVFASMGLDVVFRLVRGRAWIFLAVAALAQGVIGIIRLHPYEYVYYNELSGGVAGAHRRYELDYWCTASREAILDLNRSAPPGAAVGINKGSDQLIPFAREDLRIEPNVQTMGEAESLGLDYMIVCARADWEARFQGRPISGQITREGVPLITVRRVR